MRSAPNWTGSESGRRYEKRWLQNRLRDLERQLAAERAATERTDDEVLAALVESEQPAKAGDVARRLFRRPSHSAVVRIGRTLSRLSAAGLVRRVEVIDHGEHRNRWEAVMPRGAAVIPYRGKRGVVWRIKWTDADGQQVMETVGAERDGITEKQARAELRERLVRVERKHYRRPQARSFTAYADTWFEEGKVRRAWKPRTVLAYGSTLEHLKLHFGPTRLGSIRPRDVAGYLREASEQFAPRTVNLHLNVLHDLFKTAKAEELVDGNPVEGVERPKVRRKRWRILEPVEVARALKAFTDDQARVMFLTFVLTGGASVRASGAAMARRGSTSPRKSGEGGSPSTGSSWYSMRA